jgi:hypothetical protein
VIATGSILAGSCDSRARGRQARPLEREWPTVRIASSYGSRRTAQLGKRDRRDPAFARDDGRSTAIVRQLAGELLRPPAAATAWPASHSAPVVAQRRPESDRSQARW